MFAGVAGFGFTVRRFLAVDDVGKGSGSAFNISPRSSFGGGELCALVEVGSGLSTGADCGEELRGVSINTRANSSSSILPLINSWYAKTFLAG